MDPSQSHQPINSASAATPTPAIPLPPELAVLVVALSGLPGAGKTSLCRAIAAHVKMQEDGALRSSRENVSGPRQEQERDKAAFDREHPSGGAIHTIHVEFDAMMERWRTPGLAAAPTNGHEGEETFKEGRKRVLAHTEEVVRALKTSGGRRIGERKDEKGDWMCDCLVTGGGVVPWKDVPASHIILLDDNCFYKSMKHEVFQMCRRNHAAFLSLHLPIPLAVAIARNSQREQAHRVPEDVVMRIAGRMEQDNVDSGPHSYPWLNECVLQWNGDGGDHDNIDDLLGDIYSKWSHYVSLARDWDRREQEMENAERSKTQSRTETSESFLHQLNIRLTRVVGVYLSSIANDRKGDVGKLISAIKGDFMHRVRAEIASPDRANVGASESGYSLDDFVRKFESELQTRGLPLETDK